MTRTRTCGALIALTLVTWTVNGLAQNAKPFVPVTDEMLWKPESGGLADVAADAR